MSSSENNGEKTSSSGSGYLEISEKGFGFLRTAQNHYHPKPTDIFVTPDTIRRNFLREGSLVEGQTQPPHRGTSPQLKTVEKVNEMAFEEYTKSVRFENLTTIDPIEKFKLETSPDLLETRVIDLVTPIGRGTRGIIVASPRTGKTTILKQSATPSRRTIPTFMRWCCSLTSGPRKSRISSVRSRPRSSRRQTTWIWKRMSGSRASPSSAAGAWWNPARTFLC